MASARPAQQLAREAYTRLPAEMAMAGRTAQRHDPNFRKYYQRPLDTGPGPSCPRMSCSIANERLTQRLGLVRELCKDIEGALPRLTKYSRAKRGKRQHEDKNIARITKWIHEVQGQTHKLVSCQRLYLGLRASQLLLNVVWYTPENPRRIGLSQQILKVMEREDQGYGWPGKWKLILLYIDYARSQIPLHQPPKPPAGQLASSLPAISPHIRHRTLNHALSMVLSANRLSAITRCEATSLISESLVEEATVAIERMERINEWFRLESLVEESGMYISELDSEIRAAGRMYEAALWLGSVDHWAAQQAKDKSRQRMLALFGRI
ncbi:hypothetical protein GGR51DRAFT_544353 [Nemania sp. FL0031]|nr:hypothetical protein GGR51DRAFT_544353 [Nemania sp. FL0031]